MCAKPLYLAMVGAQANVPSDIYSRRLIRSMQFAILIVMSVHMHQERILKAPTVAFVCTSGWPDQFAIRTFVLARTLI